jgi:hypothetical protein
MSNPEFMRSYGDDDDPFMNHPCAVLFIEAAFAAHDKTGTYDIDPQTRRELMAEFGLDNGETAALAYLGRLHAAVEAEHLDLAVSRLINSKGEV